jgi:hypothetical protein
MVITNSSRSFINVAIYFNIIGLIVHYTLFKSIEEDKCVLKQENTLVFWRDLSLIYKLHFKNQHKTLYFITSNMSYFNQKMSPL